MRAALICLHSGNWLQKLCIGGILFKQDYSFLSLGRIEETACLYNLHINILLLQQILY